MSVAAMTMDDQRPLMNSYEKMSKQYEQSLHVAGTSSSAAPPSGPASPTPSGSEEPAQHQFHHSHHHHHHHHSHHLHQQQQQQYHQQHHNHHQTTIADQQQLQSEHHQHEQQQKQQQQQQQVVDQQLLQESSVVAEAVAAAEHRQRLLEDEIETLKLEQTRLTQQCADAQRREKILMRRLANKEQEFQDYVTQIAEYKAAQAPSAMALRSALLDPAVNLLFEKLKKELKATKAKLEETQNELSAWKFTPDSNTGKRLMAKCRLLYQENEELGKMTSNGRLAKLETELAMQKSFSEEVKKSQSELDDFLQELDEDVEGMQSTIIFLQQELKTTRERIQVLEKENDQLKNGIKENEIIDTMATTSSPINGGNLIINEMSTTPYQIPASAINTSSNEYKYHYQKQPPILETISENECLRTPHPEYYNGIVEDPIQRLAPVVPPQSIPPSIPAATNLIMGAEDCASSNSSNTSNNQLRTVASRKRNYDESAGASPDYTVFQNFSVQQGLKQTIPNNVQTMQQQQVSSPRTLPPKKSKLRIATSRSSEQLNELVNEMPVTSNPYNSPTTPLNLSESPVVNMSNEEILRETNNSNTLVDTVNDSVVPQRIMTRRRSNRMQQNGNGDNSNH